MADKTASHTQQTIVNDTTARMSSMLDEIAKLETKGLEQARTAVDESARLMKESFAYAEKLSAEWRRMAIETMKRSADLFTPKA